jgi:signal transduction histidine kinase
MLAAAQVGRVAPRSFTDGGGKPTAPRLGSLHRGNVVRACPLEYGGTLRLLCSQRAHAPLGVHPLDDGQTFNPIGIKVNSTTLLELAGLGCASAATFFALRVDSALPKEVRPNLVVLLSSVVLLHFLDVLEWWGLERADWFGDTFKVCVPVAWLAFLFSVTRAQLTTDLQVTSGQLRVLLEETPMGIAIASGGKWVHSNQKWLSLHGISGQIVGLSVRGSCGALGLKWEEVSARALLSGASLQGTEPATSTHPALDWSVRPWLGIDGTTGSILVVQPTDPGRTEQGNVTQPSALEAIGAAASGVAHDINNLLTVISMHSEILHLPHTQDPELARSSLDSIHQAIGMATSMTRGLLSFSKLKPLELEGLDLSALVHSSTGLLADTLSERATLHVHIEPGVWIRGNASALHQILLNLIVNARDALTDFGVITVHVHSAPQGSVLAVEDTGTGIEQAVLDRMFEPFFTTKRQQGTGLGLAVVERLVRAHAAQLSVKSVVGKGSKFSITFPSGGASGSSA